MRKSRTHGRHFVRTPSGRVVVRYIKKKSSVHRCAKCKRPLPGIGDPRGPKSSKKVNRPYGGYLCSHCAREELKRKVRSEVLSNLGQS